MENYKRQWTKNISTELLSGIVVCMALIPEAIGFTIVAGVDPIIGVYSCFTMSIIISIFGGRPAMISAAAGSMAFVLATLVRNYGVQYMLAATILAGVFQVILGVLNVSKLLDYIPSSVRVGFVNALGIMMFKSQLNHFKGSIKLVIFGMIGVAVIYFFPRINKKIPSPIISIILVTSIIFLTGIDVPTLGDMGKITPELPRFKIPNIPYNFQTLRIILSYSISLAIVGLLESLLTSKLVDEYTDTSSNKKMECLGQGFANVGTGLFGGIAGCGMIGQTVINIEYGGRGRLSTFTAGTLMMLFVILFNKLFLNMPVVALASVMIVVAIKTFNWESVIKIREIQIVDTVVMLITVTIVLVFNNLAYGVIVGSILDLIVKRIDKAK